MAEHDVGALQGIRTKANFLLAVTGKLESEFKSIIDELSYNEGEIASKMKPIDLQDDERVAKGSFEDDSKEDSDDFSENSSKIKVIKN